MTEEFLAYSASVGNDLSTPMPEAGFPGLNPGINGAYVRQDGNGFLGKWL